MSLESGARLGPYEIKGVAGAGGMGEVYRATDTRLERDVAIKVLPSHLSENEDLKKRFDREAKTISSLQHPNICALYDVGHENGIDFLVMEYLEGDTLAEKLAQGPMPIEEVLSLGVQITQALDAAHKSDVTHRDLPFLCQLLGPCLRRDEAGCFPIPIRPAPLWPILCLSPSASGDRE